MSKSIETVKSAVPAPAIASLLDGLLSIIGGAVAAMLVLWLLKFGASEVWSPFARSGVRFTGALALSALAGGLTSAILGRRLDGPLAATACSLGWALWGLVLHRSAQGQYLELSGGGFPDGALFSLIFSNAISQSLSVALALFIALGTRWLWMRRGRNGVTASAPISDDDLEGNGLRSFGTAFFYPLAILIGDALLMSLCGVLALPVGDASLQNLPSGFGIALWCGLLTMLAMGAATLGVRRAFGALSSASDAIVASLAVALVATFPQMPLLQTASLLIWHTSAFELASWGALGASLGYGFARSSLKIQ